MEFNEWKDLLKSSRSTRGYDESRKISREELVQLVDCARYAPSTMNMQPLRYRLVCEPDEVAKVQALTKWAGALKGVHLPHEGHCPPAFLVICHDTQIAAAGPGFVRDVGIVSQTIALSARVMGLGGCILGAFSADAVKEALGLDAHLLPMLIVAIGKPDETIVLTEAEKGESVAYYRDENDVHYVPKRRLEDVLI